MAFNTKLRFSDAKFYQCSGDTMALSGSTSVGSLAYIAAPTITNARDITDKNYVDACDVAASGLSLTYANTFSTACSVADRSYADGCDVAASGLSLTYANTFSTACSVADRSYADGCDVAASGLSLTYAETYADGVASAASGLSLTYAENYADACDVAASGLSLTYANTFSTACSVADRSYADGCDVAASGLSLTYANTFSTACSVADRSYADGCDVAASGLSLTYANTFSTACSVADRSYADGCDVAASGLSLTYSQDYTDACTLACTTIAGNGLHMSGKKVVLGGSLTGNTSITGSYTLSANVSVLNLTGVSTNLGGTVYIKTNPAGTGGLLCIDATTGQVCETSLAAFGGITGATNGLTDCGSQQIGLGGALCAATQVCGAQTLRFGDVNGVCLSSINTNDIALNSKSSGGVVMSSQSGTVESALSKTNSIGIQADFGDGFLIWDCRATAYGIQYDADYSTNYCDRSLVDKAYVDSIATGLQAHQETLVATTGQTSLSGLTIVDGVQLSNGDRVLAKDQTPDWQNGIYSASTGVWGRTSDYDFTPAGEVSNGDLVPVSSGDTNGSSIFIQTEPDPIVSGDSINFSQFSRLIDVTGGEGIAVTIAGTNRSVAVDLATNSGLAFTGSKLCFDNTCLTSGLTSTGTGVVTVNASNCGAIGSCIPVLFDSNCFLVVDSDDFSYTTANNGLHKEGCNVVLGGAMTGSCAISMAGATGLAFTDTRATKFGICYSGNYTADFGLESIISKRYADQCDVAASGLSLTYANTFSTACSVADRSYADACDVAASGLSLTYAQTYADACDVAASGLSLTYAQTYADACDVAASGLSLTYAQTYADACDVAASGLSLTYAQTYADACDVAASGLSLTYANTFSTACSVADRSYADGCDVAASGLSLTYSQNYTDTCVAACTITAGNGLTKLTNNITLGGTLTGATNICTDGNKLVVGGSAANVTYFCNQESGGLTGWTTQACGGAFKTRYDSIVGATFGAQHTIQAVNNTGSTTCGEIRVCEDHLQLFIRTGSTVSQLQIRYADNVFTDGFNQKGLTYGGAYESNFTDLSLVTKCYVDGASGAIGGANGLSRQTDNIVLGGALTGNTSLTGAYDLGFTHTNFNVTAAVCVTGALNTSTTATIGGALTLSSVAAGSASDSVLTITAGGVVQKISSSSLGEDNNRYVIDVVTGNTTLPTTGYTILVSGATSLTLPSGVNGMAYKIKDACGNALAAPITIVGTIDGSANASINTDYGALELAYSSTLVEWYSLAFIN